MRPRALRSGDRVAVVSSSWGGPSIFPATYEAGLKVLREDFGIEIVEARTARMAADELARNPRVRAETLNELFADDSIHGIISTIGGNDSVRILPWLDTDIALRHPKVFLGYSDTTIQNAAYAIAGLVTFNGPSVMAGFAQMRHFPEAAAHVRAMLFGDAPSGGYRAYPRWVDAYADWSTLEGADGIGQTFDHDGWRWLNGSKSTTGRLFGGCIETLEALKGTRWWPNAGPEWWRNRVLFLETSEDKPPLIYVRDCLRNYGAQGVFDEISALWFGRARDYAVEEKAELDKLLVDIVVGEFGATELPIVSNLDFGHTTPQWVLPLGIHVATDPAARTLRWLESPSA